LEERAEKLDIEIQVIAIDHALITPRRDMRQIMHRAQRKLCFGRSEHLVQNIGVVNLQRLVEDAQIARGLVERRDQVMVFNDELAHGRSAFAQQPRAQAELCRKSFNVVMKRCGESSMMKCPASGNHSICACGTPALSTLCSLGRTIISRLPYIP